MIIVTCVSDSKSYDSITREFEIPESGSYKIETIGGDFMVFDSYKNLVNRVSWQAGFTQEYEFFY